MKILNVRVSDYLAFVARNTHVTAERQKEILAQTLMGINWLNNIYPSWFSRLTKPTDMDDVCHNPKAQILGITFKAVLERGEAATGKFDDDLKRGFALIKGESDEEVVLRNLLWSAAASLLEMQSSGSSQIVEVSATAILEPVAA